ncbi:MAG: c-type cytochrome, partial [candidate division NC10 bacterium]|nr:c-type cytochrome [candidate division NC10 bacterium]
MTRLVKRIGLLLVMAVLLVVGAGPIKSEPLPEPGEGLFRRYCAVCHGAAGKGDGPNAPHLDETQPRDLTDRGYMARLSEAHLFRVIGEGGRAVDRSPFMPPFGKTLSREQLASLVSHVRRLSAGASPASAPDGGIEAAGARLVAELGCAGCHRIGGLQAAPIAPDLRRLGSKIRREWLLRFLQTPRRIRPAGYIPLSRSRMPDFLLSREEAEHLAAFLLGRRGRVPDARRAEGAPPDPGGQGRQLFLGYACRACHMRDGAGGAAGPDLTGAGERLHPGWMARYIQDPQAMDPLSPMPRLGVTAAEALAVSLYLAGNGAAAGADAARGSVPIPLGERLFRDLRCGACHPEPGRESEGRPGPDLTYVGDKLRPEWVERYLADPHPVRPWLSARMPSFGLSEAERRTVTGFLMSLRDPAAPPLPERLRSTGTVSAESLRAARQLMSREYLACFTCHLG